MALSSSIASFKLFASSAVSSFMLMFAISASFLSLTLTSLVVSSLPSHTALISSSLPLWMTPSLSWSPSANSTVTLNVSSMSSLASASTLLPLSLLASVALAISPASVSHSPRTSPAFLSTDHSWSTSSGKKFLLSLAFRSLTSTFAPVSGSRVCNVSRSIVSPFAIGLPELARNVISRFSPEPICALNVCVRFSLLIIFLRSFNLRGLLVFCVNLASILSVARTPGRMCA